MPRHWMGAVLLALSPVAVAGQGGEWPTLSGLGVEYLSRSGAVQLSLSGELDLETMYVGGQRWAGLVGHETGDSVPADWATACAECHRTEDVRQRGAGGQVTAHRLRLFADLFLGDHVYSLVEVRSDRGPAPAKGSLQARVEQAYVRVTGGRGALGLQVGKFASPFGSYPLRHLTVVDPFLRPPMPYDYRTIMSASHVPPDGEGLLTWRNWPEFFRRPGSPPVWDVPYPWGAMVFASVGPLDLRAAAVNSAPSSDPESWGFEWERTKNPSWVFGARAKPSPAVELGASYNRGPWIEETLVGSILASPGAQPREPGDFVQEMASADVAFARGPVMLRGEVILDRWEVPNLDSRPHELLYSVELQSDLRAGLSAAARVGYVDFRPLDPGGGGVPVDWDADAVRLEGSLGYRLARNSGVLLSAYRQSDVDGRRTVLAGVRTWWAF